jgi:hypothetical protein
VELLPASEKGIMQKQIVTCFFPHIQKFPSINSLFTYTSFTPADVYSHSLVKILILEKKAMKFYPEYHRDGHNQNCMVLFLCSTCMSIVYQLSHNEMK